MMVFSTYTQSILFLGKVVNPLKPQHPRAGSPVTSRKMWPAGLGVRSPVSAVEMQKMPSGQVRSC